MNILTVSQLNFYVKSVMEADSKLQNVFVTGEISNLTDRYRSGHIYLSLKDSDSVIKAVMFAGNASRLKFKPFDGMKIIARGRVSLYEAAGAYQFYIEDMQPDGIGALSLAFEQLKAKLEKEGLFDAQYKRKLPAFPEKIGVITSPAGAAVQDITKILKRRYPIADVVLCPVAVQGDGAAEQLCAAVRRLNREKDIDVIIIGRGGGSMEDLWAFNDEQLAYEIYNSQIPVISAVGHETDFTVCDFVADVRASTPSAAAELAVPDGEALLASVEYFGQRLYKAITERIEYEREILDNLTESKALTDFTFVIKQSTSKLEDITARLKTAEINIFNQKASGLTSLSSKLEALSPLKVLGRGYAIASKDGSTVSSVVQVKSGDMLNIKLIDGDISCTVV